MKQGRDAPIGEKRQPIDQLLIGVYRVCSRRENLVDRAQGEGASERDGLACRAGRQQALPGWSVM